MITLVLTTMIMAGLTSSYMFLMENSISLGNYSDMNFQTRIGLEKFGRDIRMATKVYTMTTTVVDIDIPKTGGGVTKIKYQYSSPNKTLSRIQLGTGGGTQVILRDVQSFALKYTDHAGATTASTTFVKRVQLDLEMRRNVLTLENTNHVISAHYMMRMKSGI